jgi:hypothetical protein
MRKTTTGILILLLLWLCCPAPGQEVSEEKTVEEFFKGGRVEKWKARRITIAYDFKSARALEDFVETNPFLVERSGGFSIEDDALAATGSGALVWKGICEDDVVLTATFRSAAPRDMGFVLLKPGWTDQFLLFSLADNFFSKKDRQKPGQHMITVVGAKDGGSASESLFRYLERSLTPKLVADADIELRVQKRGKVNRMRFAGKTLKADDRYGSFPSVQPGLFVLQSTARVTGFTISGKLSESFLVANGIAFDPDEVDDEAAPEPETAAEEAPAEESPRGGREDATDAKGLVRRLRDRRLTDDERKEAAKGLHRDNVKEAELKALIDCLYSDDLTTRKLAITALKKATGKTLGYNPTASEDARKKAIRNWFKYLMQNRDRLR